MSSAVGDLGCSVDNVDFVTVIYTTGYQPSGGKRGVGDSKVVVTLLILRIRNVTN